MKDFSKLNKLPRKNGFRSKNCLKTTLKSDSLGVSEAIGTILLLSIAIMLVGVVAYWVQTLPTPDEVINTDLDSWMELDASNEHVVYVKHMGGDRLDAYSTEILIKINDFTEAIYSLDESIQPIFDNNLWEIDEVWSENIEGLHIWGVPQPKVTVEVRDISTDRLLLSDDVQLGGVEGNLPDLKVSEEDINFDFLNETLRKNEWVNISVNVHNIGEANAANILVRIFDGSEIIAKDNKDYILINSISVGQFETVWVNWTPEYSGLRTINVKVYSTQLEANYGNNHATKRLEVEPIIPKITGPNFEIEAITFSPETPTHGDWVTITVLVKNVGDEEVPSGTRVNVTLWDERGFLISPGVYINRSTTLTENLTVYETIQPEFTYRDQTTYGGTTTIYAEVTSTINESRYDDNRAYRHLQILPTILLVDDDGIIGGYTRDDASSYMDAALQLAVGTGQFDVWPVKTTDGPKFSSGDKPLRNYDIVIWMTGYQTTNTLTAADQSAIQQYLNNNGKLWLVGMNVLSDIGAPNSFAYNYLGVANYQTQGTPDMLYGVIGENLTEGMKLNTSNKIVAQDNGANLTLRPTDFVNHTIDGILGNDQVLGLYGNNSLKYYNATNNYKVVYFGWEFASIIDMVDRNNLTIQILKWFGWELEIGTDLAIASKGFSDPNPNFMDWITISARVRNNGPRDLIRVRVDFFIIDSNSIERRIPEYSGFENKDNPQFIPRIGGGSEVEVTKQWLAVSVGQHTFRVVVDIEDEIEEVSEENNDDFYSPLFVTQLVIGYTILVVDDDNSTNNGGTNYNVTENVTNSLDELGYIYDLNVTTGGLTGGSGPNITVMKHYNTVIWCTGYEGNATLLPSDQEHLGYYATRSNFSEANFLGETKFNLLVIGQGILDDLGGSGVGINPPPSSFIYNYLQVNQYTTVGSQLPDYLSGVYRDNITHGNLYPIIQSTLDEADIIQPHTNASGIFWQDPGQTNYNSLKYSDTIHNLVFMPWEFSLLNDTTTIQFEDESYKNELLYLILRWFDYPDNRFELKTSNIDIELSSQNPVLGNSYIIKTDVYNIGGNNTNTIVRFLDGDTVIDTKSIFVPANGMSSTEVIWSPLFAGYRDLRILVDPDNDMEEVFDSLNNNASMQDQLIYFFYDDLENGTSNWAHDSTILLINGESPLDFLDRPVFSNINSTWDYSISRGFRRNSSVYHSFNYSFYTLEPIGLPKKPLDVVLVADTSSSMLGQKMIDMKAAVKNFINSSVLDARDRMAIYNFSGETPLRVQNFTECDKDGKVSLINTTNNLVANGYSPIWDAMGEAINYTQNFGSNRIPVVIALCDGWDYGIEDQEDGSETFSPWHNWSDGVKLYRNQGSIAGEDFFTYDDAGNPPAQESSWDWVDLDDETRYGLLNVTNVTVYTIGIGGIGFQHNDHSSDTTSRFPDGWMGSYAQYEDIQNSWPGDYSGDIYNESGTPEFNLWRVANTSEGKYYHAATSSELNNIFKQIANEIIEETPVERSSTSRTSRAPRASLFTEDFETGDFGTRWTPDSGDWLIDSALPHLQTYCAMGQKSHTDWSLTLTNNEDFSNYNNLYLTFWQRSTATEANDNFNVDVSTNGGSTWTLNVGSWTGAQISESYQLAQVSLTAYDQSAQFKIRFRFNMNHASERWRIDDIEITGDLVSTGGGGGEPPVIELFKPGDRNLTTYPFSLVNVTSAKLSFYHKYDLRNALNGIVVMVGTTTNGINWSFEYVKPTQPYTNNILVTEKRYDDFGKEMKWCWNGVSGNGLFTWDYVEVDLTNWTGMSNLRARIVFLWAGAGDGGSYHLDDFTIKVTRNDTIAITNASVDQWELTSSDAHSGNHCWWNRNATTNHLTGGLDNSLYTRPIDLTNARNATLSAYFKFNINDESGRPPDGFRVEISSDNGISWKAINLGVRSSWGVSTNGTDADDGVTDGKSYSGIDVTTSEPTADGWVEANTLTRLNTDITGWAGNVILIRFRLTTASDDNPHFGGKHYEWSNPTHNAYGFKIDDVIIYGYSLQN